MSEDIVLIDDDKLVLKILKDIFETHGFKVSTFSDPEEGMNYVIEKKPRLAIIDYYMPKLTGADLIIRFSEKYQFQYTDVILCTSMNIDDEMFVKLKTLGFTKIVPKPLEQENVLEIIELLKEHKAAS